MVQVSYGTLPFAYIVPIEFISHPIDSPQNRRNQINCVHLFVLSSSFLRTLPRHGRRPPSKEYSRPPGHNTLLGETTRTKRGFSLATGVPCFQVAVSTRVQSGMRQDTSLKQPAKGRTPLHRWSPVDQPARSKENRTLHTAFSESSPSGPFPRLYFLLLAPLL